MNQNERWIMKWQTAVAFIETNKRNPSKFEGSEREIKNWIKHQRKLLNTGSLKEDRMEKFRELMELMELMEMMERNRRVNQYE